MKVVHVDSGIKLIVSKGVKGDGLAWAGEWSASKTYQKLDTVSRGGASWISVKNDNRGHDPLTDDGTWWDCMVADSLAEAARDKAEQWANNPKNVAVEPGKYSAYHWSQIAYDNGKAWAENPEDMEVAPGQYSAFHYKEKALTAQIRAEYAAANAELVALGGIPI